MLRLRSVVVPLLVAAAGVIARPAAAIQVYSNDFQTAAGPEWSATTISSTPLPADGSRRFLGRFDNQSVTLMVGPLAAHTQATIECDLYINGTWDGVNSSPYGPDVWALGVTGGATLLNTTFSNVTSPPFGIPFLQNYPDAAFTATHPQFTGATETRTLGYIFSGFDCSAVYHLSYTFPHTASQLGLTFAGQMGWEYGGPHNIDEESWGLDNVVVSTDATSSVGNPPVALAITVANPVISRAFEVSCSLPIADAARIEVLDASGRRVAHRDVSGIGTHTVALDTDGRLPPGLYFVELVQGGNERVARVAVLR